VNQKRKITRRDFLRILKEFFLSLTVAGIGSLVYGFFVEPNWIDVNELEINLSRLPKAFSGFRILQLSDIHMGGWMDRECLAKVVELALAQQADLIVLTGDYVFRNLWITPLDLEAADFVEEISKLTKTHLVLGILGNHDHWVDAARVRGMLAASGVIELENDVYPLEKDGALLFVAGVDDIWEKKYDLDKVMNKLPQNGVVILLAHEPDFADISAETGRFDLQLSGHSHGGQVASPFFGAPVLPHLGQKYYSGLYKVREMWQYTNRGVGMIEPAVRINCRPEITIFTLKSD
jgi:predicted MPP superfamily phosphohydrolase